MKTGWPFIVVAATMAVIASSVVSFADGAAPHPQIISPDVPLEFVTSIPVGGGPRVVLTSPRWTILLDYHDEIITDAEGPRIRKLFRRPAAGGDMEEVWDGSLHGKGGDNAEMPHVWVAYDDGAVLFSRGTELDYVAKPGVTKHWAAKVDGEECLPIYADTSGIVLWPRDFTRSREAWYIPGERDAFDVEGRIKITGANGIRYPEPLVKRHGNLLVWLDWLSYDQPGATRYRLSLFDLETRKGWSKDVDIRGTARMEHFDGHTVQVSGQRYDAVTGNKK